MSKRDPLVFSLVDGGGIVRRSSIAARKRAARVTLATIEASRSDGDRCVCQHAKRWHLKTASLVRSTGPCSRCQCPTFSADYDY